MTEIISTWIRSRLGVIIDLTGPSIGNCCRDGTFYAKLLHSYAVINDSQLNTITHTSDPALARVNLRHLQVWLRFIGVDCDQEAINDISNAKGTSAFHLLYKIYLCLENKDRLHFITLEKEREKYVPASTKFDVRVVPEEPEFDPTLPEHPLLKLLAINTRLSDSHKEDVRKMITNYLQKRQSRVQTSKASEILPDIEEVDDKPLKSKTGSCKIDKKEVKRNAKKKMMKELDDFAERHSDVSRSSTEEAYEVHGRPEAAKEYIEELKFRRKRESEMEQRSKEIQNQVLEYFWNKFDEDQEKHFDSIIASYVLRQSEYEKKMTTKLCEIRRQKDRIAANRQMVNDMMFKAKEDHMRLVEESKREMKSWDDEESQDEVLRLNELQKRLQDEKEEKVRAEVCKIARDVVDDVINLAAYLVDSEIPRELWSEWKNLFVKGFKIFPHQDLIQENNLNVSQNFQDDFNVDKDLDDYIEINAPWSEFIPEIDQENKKFLDLGSVVLGYIVHKLLKFPQFIKPKLPEVKTRAILLGIPDSQHSTLSDLLKHKKINVIRVENALNYCLQCYKDEKRDEDSVEEFKLETNSELSFESALESLKSGDKSDKKTQTPRAIPFDDMHPTLSDSAYIGEWVHRFFITGEPISDELMSKVLFEYLKSFDNIKGWVLINYPSTYRQLAFLELTLSGKLLSDVELFSLNEEDFEFEPQIKFTDSSEVCRESKLLVNPLKFDGKYNSFLTLYVKMIEKFPKVQISAEQFEIRPEDTTRVDEFYKDQGIAQVIFYDEFDSETLKRIAKLIIGDKESRKSSEESPSSVKSLSVESQSLEPQELKIKPGEVNWTWIDLPLSSEVTKGLISLWKNCESTYVDGLKDILALKRLNLTAVVSYKDFIYSRVIVSEENSKAELVQKFKEAFNGVIENGIDKDELRGNVEEFQMELWEICDAKRLKAEEKKKKIVEDDWSSKQIIVLVNIYVRIMQVEMDRFVDTLQFLRWYYLAMLQRKFEDNIFEKIVLEKVTGNEKCPKLPEINDKALRKEIHNLMLGVDNSLEETTNHCFEIIKPTIDLAVSTIEDLSNSSVDDLTKERSIKSKRRSSVKVKKKSDTSEGSVKPKKVKLGFKKKNLFSEWEYALMYEINRVKMRIQMTSLAVKSDIRFLLGNIKHGFFSAGRSINEIYRIEINNVNDLIKLFEEAIENRHTVGEINLVDDCFVIPEAKTEPQVPEEEVDDKFRIEQLCYLKDIFQSVEPRGVISKVSFVYILQDLVSCEEETVEEELKDGEYVISSLPTAWFKLTPQEVTEIVNEVFEDDTVDWREFIIYALDVNLSQDAMLDALDAFKQKDGDKDKIISRKEFFSVHLWPFNLENEKVKKSDVENSGQGLDLIKEVDEEDQEDIARLYLMKLFVCDMFSSGDTVNYMEILLAFCKDDEAIYGFGKALSIYLGQKICMDYDEGEKYVASLEKENSKRDIKRTAKRVSKEFVDELVDSIHVNLNIENSESVFSYKENKRELNSSDEDLKSDEDLLLYYNENYFDEQCHDIVYFNAGGRRARRKSTRKMVYWVSIDLCESVLTSLLPQIIIEDVEESTGVSLKENLRAVSKELRCNDTKSRKLVLAHRLIRHDFIGRMLKSTNRFTFKNLSSILRKVIKAK